MLRIKHTQNTERYVINSTNNSCGSKSHLEENLLEFMDSFDVYLFLYDKSYRRRLNSILDGFTNEEFECFERAYSHRFIMN